MKTFKEFLNEQSEGFDHHMSKAIEHAKAVKDADDTESFETEEHITAMHKHFDKAKKFLDKSNPKHAELIKHMNKGKRILNHEDSDPNDRWEANEHLHDKLVSFK